MTRCWRRCGFQLAIASSVLVGGVIAYKGDCAFAQIAPDGTLPNNSIVTSQGNTSVISGGTQAGSNLFHSFDQFSIPTGDATYFNNALDIQNIISRVTGESVSNINGLIRANGAANLFLLNPNGIIFGPNAELNIGGSFLASTASSLNFADGKQFSATNPQFPPLLTVSVPIGLQFGKNPGSILNQSVVVDSFGIPIGLQVQPGKTLALVGGDVMLEGGNLTAYAGRIELGSVAGPSLVSLAPTASGWALGYEGVQNFRDIQLSQAATVDASGEGGDIQVQGRRIEVRDGSVIGAFTVGSLSGGTLSVNASDSVELIGTTVDGKMPSGLFTQALSTGDAGNLTIATGQLIVRNGAQVSASTVAEGQGGSLAVAASDSVELTGTSTNGQFSSGLFAEAEGAGKAGRLYIKTRRLIVRDAAEVNVSNQGLGDAGELMVQVRDLMLENFGELTAESASGQGGNISLQVEDFLLMRRNSQISINARRIGDDGNLDIDTKVLIASENSDIILNLDDEVGGFLFAVTTQGFFLSPDSDIIVGSGEELELDPTSLDFERIVLPEDAVDVTGLIAQGCAAVGENKFTITGRGGLPPSPNEVLSSDAVWVDWGTLNPKVENRSGPPVSTNPTVPDPAPIVEARGWVINSKGEVVLMATAPTVTPHNPWIPSATCHTSETSS